MADDVYFQKSKLLNEENYKNIISKIPCNPLATDEMIKKLKDVPKDEKPLDLVFAIEYENSKNGRVYTTECYKDIVEQILTSEVFIPVCYGHQSPEAFTYEGRQIVGSVIGALLDEKEKIVYYRVIPDSSEKNKDLRRWIRNKQINSLSIWGLSEGEEQKDGKQIITKFTLRSIDFVPPLSEGQKNAGLVIGESENASKTQKTNGGCMSEKIEVDIKNIYNSELVGEMKARLLDGRISIRQLTGEGAGLPLAEKEELEKVIAERDVLKKETERVLEKIKTIGFTSIDDLLKFAFASYEKEKKEKENSNFNKIVEEEKIKKGLIKDGKPTGQMAEFVDKWAHLKVGMSREEIAKNIDIVINDASFKKLSGEMVGAHSNSVDEAEFSQKKEAEVLTI